MFHVQLRLCPKRITFGYEIEAINHVQPEECQQQCSYDIDHKDAPA